MEIILTQDVNNLGSAHETVKVKNGYARNYLIPRGMAIPATESNKKVVAELLRQKAHKEAKILKSAQELAKTLETIRVTIKALAASSGKLYGSVNNIQIAEAIKEQFGYEVDRRKIIVDGEHIKELGTYSAKINLHKEVKIQIQVDVVAAEQ